MCRAVLPISDGKIILFYDHTALADFPEPKVVDLVNIVGVHAQSNWQSVGLRLGLETPVLKTLYQQGLQG